jgi:two-component system, NarL family, response regulator NreC
MNRVLRYSTPLRNASMGPRALLRILVVDDHEIVRRSICALLSGQPDFEVVCDAADGVQAVKEAERLQPDVVVLDITMPGMGGLEAAPLIRKVAPSAEIVFLSQYDSLQTIQEAFRRGARGYVVKSDAYQDLIPAIRAARKKQRFVNARLATGV